jgi:hypothetical protein
MPEAVERQEDAFGHGSVVLVQGNRKVALDVVDRIVWMPMASRGCRRSAFKAGYRSDGWEWS